MASSRLRRERGFTRAGPGRAGPRAGPGSTVDPAFHAQGHDPLRHLPAELATNTELPEEAVTRLSVLRKQQLARAGLARTECPVSDYIKAGLNLRVVSASGRGNMSPEAIMIQDARSRMKRADKCGFQSIEDRFEHDVQFMERMLQMGYDHRAAQRQDWLCHAHLANPPRN